MERDGRISGLTPFEGLKEVKCSTCVPAAAAPDCEGFLCRTSGNCWGCWPSE